MPYFCSMISVVLVGTGNVAKHLFDAFSQAERIKVVQVVGRDQNALKQFGKATADLGSIANADVYIIAVSDDAIYTVSQLLTHKKGLVIHTSGSVSLETLFPNKNTGVFYPLQTFSKNREVDFGSVPICIESNTEPNLNLLEDLGNAISKKVHKIDSEQRKTLHLAAIFANNFTNHLYHIANKICEDHQVPFNILKPLLQETAQKVQTHMPFDMQTGPARRNDIETIKKHLAELRNGRQKEIYALLSESIRETYSIENSDK